VWLPRPFGQPQAGGSLSKESQKLVAHELDLRDSVAFRKQLQDGLVEASTDQFQLASRGQLPDEVQVGRQMIPFDELQEWPRGVKRDLDTREIGQRFEDWQIGSVDGLSEYVVEVADRLVIMNAQTQLLDITPPSAGARNPFQGASSTSLP